MPVPPRPLAGSKTAVNQAALDAAQARKLALRIRDPSAQIAQVAARGGFIRADLQKLKGEITALRSLPRPKATSILTKSPVARPSSTDEFHFELRRGRISFIDLERLLELAKSDAQVRIRMSDRSGLITSQVGPVRAFSLAYVLGRANAGIDELIERQSIRFDLKGWEIVPESEQRGETYEATRNPISEYTPPSTGSLPADPSSRSGSTPTASRSIVACARSWCPAASAWPAVPCPRA